MGYARGTVYLQLIKAQESRIRSLSERGPGYGGEYGTWRPNDVVYDRTLQQGFVHDGTINRSPDLGRITEEMVAAVRAKNPRLIAEVGPVRLEANNDHAFRDHLQERTGYGYDEPAEYFRETLRNFNQIYAGSGDSLILAWKRDGGLIAYIRLKRARKYWSVASGHPTRGVELERLQRKGRLLWASGPGDASDSGSSGPLSTPPLGDDRTGRTLMDLMGPQQPRENIADSEPEGEG